MQHKSRSGWIGETINNRYEVEAELGQGGMSAVYKAIDPNLNRPVAIKLIHPHLSSDAEFVRRFELEAAAVAKLRHPHIIQVYDFDHDEDLYYMVLEFVPGDTLQAKLKKLNVAKQDLPLNEIIEVMAKICEAVGYAHEQGMIHRDLKPANVMINPKGDPILMDFGVAKILGSAQHTATGAIIGTAKYMSPEQSRGDRPDERTDIYSLGVILFEMVAGEVPFNADSTVAILMKHVTEPLPDIQTIKPDTPNSLVEIIKKALTKDKKDRFDSATDMAQALRTCLSGQTEIIDDATILQSMHPLNATEVASPSYTGALGKQRGIPGWAIGGAVVVVLLILATIGFFLFSGSNQPTDTSIAATTENNDAQALPTSDDMIRIPAGSYSVGIDKTGDSYAPIQQVDLKEFWIDQYEVANNQYAQFVTETNHEPPANWGDSTPPTDQEDHPVSGIAWETAVAYCTWANKRLPTEAEWEVAARGSEGRLFPWGNNQSVVSLPGGGTYKIGDKPTNQSPFGVFDMAGNVWEWVGDTYTAVEQGNRVLHGGANGFLQNMAYRLQGDPNTPTIIASAGIRCAAGEVAITASEPLAQDVLSSDDFVDPGSGWPILAEGEYFYGYHPPDFYHMQVNTTDSHIVISRDPSLADFTVETNVQTFSIETEEGSYHYGLTIRRSDDEKFYAFVVSPRSGIWSIIKSSPGKFEVLQEGTVDTLVGIAPPGFNPSINEIDSLRVDAKGASFIFHINNEPVAYLEDSSYASGEIGFFVENFDEPYTHIHYDLFTIREIDFDESIATQFTPQEETEPTVESEVTEKTVTTEQSDTLPTAKPEPTEETTAELMEETTVEPTEAPTAEPEATQPPPPEPSTDNMILIPAGFFLMGSETGEPNESPEHPIFLDSFYIDQFEVTNADFGSSGQSDLPVISVNWHQANDYCQSLGKQLPSEAQWEYAASGPENFTWPWGNEFDVNKSAASAPNIQPVGSYADGVSPFGVYDMAGNVTEWVADTFNPTIFTNSPARNPMNGQGGNDHIFRGGSYGNPDGSFYTTSRRYIKPSNFSDVDVGFRCALHILDTSPPNPQLVAEFCGLFDTNKPKFCP